MDGNIKNRNNRRVELTFSVLDAMEELRDVWRSTAPLMELDAAALAKVEKQIGKARKALDGLEKTL